MARQAYGFCLGIPFDPLRMFITVALPNQQIQPKAGTVPRRRDDGIRSTDHTPQHMPDPSATADWLRGPSRNTDPPSIVPLRVDWRAVAGLYGHE